MANDKIRCASRNLSLKSYLNYYSLFFNSLCVNVSHKICLCQSVRKYHTHTLKPLSLVQLHYTVH